MCRFRWTFIILVILLVISMPDNHALADTAETYLASGTAYDPGDNLSEGQKNIVRRARQLMEIRWTPLEDRYQWAYAGTFSAGTEYIGVPYGQPVQTGYFGYQVTPSEFLEAINNSESRFYNEYSWYNSIAPVYSCDCSGFVSYSWGLSLRRMTYSLWEVSTILEEKTLDAIQVGDSLNNGYGHAVLVTAVRHKADGSISSIDIMEQTPVICQYTRYGEGGTRTLAQLQNNYLNSGFSIYRYIDRDTVTYSHDCAVPIDYDYCNNCRAAAPSAVLNTTSAGGKTVTLSHKDRSAVIYYTLDGSDPLTKGKKYVGTFNVYTNSQLRACAVTNSFKRGWELKLNIDAWDYAGAMNGALIVQLPFVDVPENAWYYSAVFDVYERSLFQGTSDTLFSPAQPMTRGMFVTILGRMAGVQGVIDGVVAGNDVNLRSGAGTHTAALDKLDLYDPLQILGMEGEWYYVQTGDNLKGYIRRDLVLAYNNDFSDLTEGKYYTSYVKWAKLTGIAGGSGGKFRADENIRREELCLMLYNYIKAFGYTLPEGDGQTNFADSAQIASYASKSVDAISDAGIINGTGNNCFEPKSSATRAQVAQLCMKFREVCG